MGYSRQSYYKRLKIENRRTEEENRVVSAVRYLRLKQPRVGCRKLQKMLESQGVMIGRDRLFSVLRKRQMLVIKKKKNIRTTQSYHRFRTYKNLVKGRPAQSPDEVFVSDITYVDTMEGYSYLSLITDQYSRKIVGYSLSKSLSVEGSVKALRMALKGVSEPSNLIHHSDRGIQYCSKAYTDLLKSNFVKISMTEENHVYENALAERINGILKDEFMLGEKLQSFKVAKKMVKEAVKTYNNDRLHLALDYMTPEQKYAA